MKIKEVGEVYPRGADARRMIRADAANGYYAEAGRRP